MTLLSTYTPTGVAGHAEDCLCIACMAADFEAATGQPLDAGRALLDAGPERTRYAKPSQRCGNGFVRLVTPKQVKLIKFLLHTRDTSKLVRLPGSENVEQMSLTGARDLIDRLFGCPELPGSKTVPMISDKQQGFLATLIDQRDTSGIDLPADLSTLTMKQASAMIDRLMAAPRKPRPAAVADGRDELVPGLLYRSDAGEVIRVRRAKHGGLYGLVLNRSNGDAWIYSRGIIRAVTAKHLMPVADVEALSIELGECGMCGRALTATVDGVGPALRSIGPVCGGRQASALAALSN